LELEKHCVGVVSHAQNNVLETQERNLIGLLNETIYHFI